MNPATPLVSIIAICHRHERFLQETLESIRQQDYPAIQLIVINNLKDTCEVLIQNWLSSYHKPYLFIQNESPKDLVSNLNMALNKVEGDYFQCISCDDILLPEKISKQVALYASLSNDFACVYSNIQDIDEAGNNIVQPYGSTLFDKRKHQNIYTEHFGSLKTQLKRMSYISAPSVLIKTSIIKKLGGYDTAYRFEDYPLWIKLEKNGYKFAFVNEVTVLQRQLSSSLGRSKNVMEKGFAKLYLKNILFFDFKMKRFIKAILTLVDLK